MRPSPLRHPLAILRQIVGLNQKELAALVGCHTATIQSVELNSGRLKLSETLAQKISIATGASINWLLSGNVKTKPTTITGTPFTKEYYQEHRAAIEGGGQRIDPVQQSVYALFSSNVLISKLLADANRQGKLDVMCWRIMDALLGVANDGAGGKREELFPCAPCAIPPDLALFGISNVWDKLLDALASNKELDIPAIPMPLSPKK